MTTPPEPRSRPGSVPRDTLALRLLPVLRNLRLHPLASVVTHGTIGLALVLAGEVWAGLAIALASIVGDQVMSRWAMLTATAVKAEVAAGSGPATRHTLRVLMVMAPLRGLVAHAAPAALLMTGTTVGKIGAMLVLAANMAVFVAQYGALRRLVALSAAPALLLLAAMAGIALGGELGAPLAIIALAYAVSTCVLGELTRRAHERTAVILLEKDAKAAELEAALALVARQRDLLAIVEGEAGIGHFLADRDGKPLMWSDGVYRLLGIDPAEGLPTQADLAAMMRGDDGERLRDAITTAFETDGAYHGRSVVEARDGVRRRVSLHIVPDRGVDGAVSTRAGVLIDQTAHLAAMERARLLEQRLETALSQGGSLVWEHDCRTGEVLAFGAVDRFLAPGGSLLERIVTSLHPDDVLAGTAAVKQAYQTGAAVQYDQRFRPVPGGPVRHARVSTTVQGNPIRGEGIIRSLIMDVDDEVMRREALDEARRQAELASEAKSVFLANMSHEIRTPLNGIVAVAAAMSRLELQEGHAELVSIIRESGSTLERVLNDVLDLARVESGRLEIDAAPMRVDDLVRSLSALHELRATEKSLGFVVDTGGEVATPVLGDAVRLRQILGNFLSNAIKFTEAGSVTLRTRAHRAGDAVEVLFEVEDTGDGMSEDELGRLFGRFEQLDPSITRRHGGSGLGLSICDSLARIMGAAIEVRSQPGAGSVFALRVRLPLAPAETGAAPAGDPASRNPDDAALRVLAADDHPTNRRILQLVLEPLGFDLALCEHGGEAVAACAGEVFDVVLMDLQMPVMDGLTAIRQIREAEAAEGRTPVAIVAVSANAMTHHRTEALEAGADGHVAKPFTPESLLAGMSAALDRAGERRAADAARRLSPGA